ncbi:glycosyltransferase family 9 protein [Fusobacterium perfoetens]|uniref:glycosyltransferase family 9 protein n=1 Tax=Fusobacterium perfoetens TaxID=852 RepID=UPI0026EE5420|nr:glycosyltransferase family 9 protein [Fusobacterium perfoetens]
MIRKLNRIFQDYMREKRLKFGKWLWDRKKNKEIIKEGNFIENNNIKSILFLRYDGKIGDMVINTLMFREIKKRYPYIKIGVVARDSNAEIIKNNSNVDNIYIYKKNRKEIVKLAEQIKKDKYDLLIDFSEMLRVNQMMLINKVNARFNMGLDKQNWELFDISYKKNINLHISKMYEEILKKLGLKNINLDYDLYILPEKKIKVNYKYILLNPYAASKHRSLNKENIVKIANKILKMKDLKLVLIGEKGKYEELKKISNLLDKDRIIVPETKDILDVMAWIEQAYKIITPDTSIVHIAVGLKKPLIAIYRQDILNDKNSIIWGPNFKEAKQIFSKDIVAFGEESDINKFDIEEIEI